MDTEDSKEGWKRKSKDTVNKNANVTKVSPSTVKDVGQKKKGSTVQVSAKSITGPDRKSGAV